MFPPPAGHDYRRGPEQRAGHQQSGKDQPARVIASSTHQDRGDEPYKRDDIGRAECQLVARTQTRQHGRHGQIQRWLSGGETVDQPGPQALAGRDQRMQPRERRSFQHAQRFGHDGGHKRHADDKHRHAQPKRNQRCLVAQRTGIHGGPLSARTYARAGVYGAAP